MEAKRSFTPHELKIMKQFPLIAYHQTAANMLEAINLCRHSIQQNQLLTEKMLDEMSLQMFPSEYEEYKENLNILIDHIAFCECSIYEAKATLNEVIWILN